jgi:hypothetical protein
MPINSSNSGTAKTLAEPELIRGLVDLANLRDDPAAFERFHKRWHMLADVYEETEGTHCIHETGIPPRFWLIFDRRQGLRDIWKQEEDHAAYLRDFLMPEDPPEELRAKGYVGARDDESGYLWGSPFALDWNRSRIIYQPETEFQRAVYALFRKSALGKVCKNPNCPAPYFVARKATQRYCSDKCAEVFQQEWKRKWWAQHGNEWRRGKAKAKKPSVRKRRSGSTP